MITTRTLGASGPEVSAVGLGCMGMSALYGPADEAEGIATIHAALDALRAVGGQWLGIDGRPAGKACGTANKQSVNPAPKTNAGIYIIHNSNENSTYVGYADDAQNRWKARTEVFHTLGIPRNYAKRILCAFCVPSVLNGPQMFLAGQNACEHLLIRAVVNGLLGVTTNTNSQLANAPFTNNIATQVRVYLPSDPWGRLDGRQQVNLGQFY